MTGCDGQMYDLQLTRHGGKEMSIQFILLDVDDTLLDFGACSAQAARESFARFGLPYSQKAQDVFRAVTAQLWGRLEKGELTRQQIYDTRWVMVFQILGIDADGLAFEACFHALLAQSHIPVPGAQALLADLATRYALYAASNAPQAQQENRLQAAGLQPYLRGIFTSERIGFSKPDSRFFQGCLAQMGASKEQVALIGDSQTADVAGGLAYGLRTCWFNRTGQTPLPGLHPDWTVRSLEEIREIF